MRKFNGRRSIEEILIDARSRGSWIDTSKYERGGDFIRIGWVGDKTGNGFLVFYPHNGMFFVYDNKDKNLYSPFSTDPLDKYDNEEWFKEILYFIHGKENEVRG